VLAVSRYRLTATAYLPGAAAVGVESRIRALVENRVRDSDPEVRVALTDQVTVEFTVVAATATEARADGREVALEVLQGASPLALDAVELLTPPRIPA
jgi:hypothetical protein